MAIRNFNHSISFNLKVAFKIDTVKVNVCIIVSITLLNFNGKYACIAIN